MRFDSRSQTCQFLSQAFAEIYQATNDSFASFQSAVGWDTSAKSNHVKELVELCCELRDPVGAAVRALFEEGDQNAAEKQELCNPSGDEAEPPVRRTKTSSVTMAHPMARAEGDLTAMQLNRARMESELLGTAVRPRRTRGTPFAAPWFHAFARLVTVSKSTGADDAAESTSIDMATLVASQLVAAPEKQTSSEVELAAPLDVLPLSTVHPQTSPACRVRVLKP